TLMPPPPASCRVSLQRSLCVGTTRSVSVARSTAGFIVRHNTERSAGVEAGFMPVFYRKPCAPPRWAATGASAQVLDALGGEGLAHAQALRAALHAERLSGLDLAALHHGQVEAAAAVLHHQPACVAQ